MLATLLGYTLAFVPYRLDLCAFWDLLVCSIVHFGYLCLRLAITSYQKDV